MRILHCFRSPVGGIFRHVRDLAEVHHKAGHQVGIICDSTTGGSFEDSLFDAIRPYLSLGLTRIPIRRSVGPSDLIALLEVSNEIKRLQPDILHGHGAKGGVLARMIGTRLRVSRSRVSRLYTPHGGSLHYSPKSMAGRFYFTAERLLEKWTDSLVFVGNYERQTYSEKIGPPKTNAALIYNGLREDEFIPVDPNPDASDFLYIGMMRDLKGPDVFIDAFAKAEQIVGRPLRGTMVGDGPQKPEYEDRLELAGIIGRVKMLPSMPAREAFKLARTVVVPSRSESMPYIVLETLAARLPIITTNVGGIPEILGTDNPAMAAPGNSEQLAERMARSITESDWLTNAMPETEEFRSRFSASVMAGSMLDLYQKTQNQA